MELWSQTYDPLNNTILSTLVCAIPVLVLLGWAGNLQDQGALRAIAGLDRRGGHRAAAAAHAHVGGGGAALFGALFALTTICWIIVNLIFLYRHDGEVGLFRVLQDSIGGITNDRRLQLILIAFCFGAFFEGCSWRRHARSR
jgi:lactate permease